MVRYIKADSENFIDHSKIRAARRKMWELLDILDSMNEPTFGEFDQNCTADVYTDISDSLASLSRAMEK